MQKKQATDERGSFLLETKESKIAREQAEAETAKKENMTPSARNPSPSMTREQQSKQLSADDPVNQFLKRYAKFKESVDWILKNPSDVTEEIVERFYKKVAGPLDEAWDKVSDKTKRVLIDKKIV